MSYDLGPGRVFRALFVSFIFLFVAACASSGDNLDGSQTRAVPGTPQHFVVTVGDRVFFQTDSTSLTNASKATLDKQARWLTQYSSFQILIEGHADERGTREYNLALGARRATAARNYLVSKGIPASRVRTISFGKERPVAVCDDISCWSQNRRAVTVLEGQPGS